MLRKAHRFLTGLGLPLTLALGAVPSALACGAFGTSAPTPEGPPPQADPAPAASAPPMDAAVAPPDAASDAPSDAPLGAPPARFVGTTMGPALPGARAYARSADARTFALLDRGPGDSVALVDALGFPGKRWRSEAPGVSLAMLTTTSVESEVQEGLAAVIIEDNSTRRMRIGSGHNERGLKGNVVATAGSFVFVATDAAITQAEVDARLDVVDNSARTVLADGAREPFALSTSGRVLLRRGPGVASVYIHFRPNTQIAFGAPTWSTFEPAVQDLELLAVGPNGDTFLAAGRCVAALPAKCLWSFVPR